MRNTDILIVDDEMGIRDLLSEILQDEGYGVALAENAEVARQMRQQVRPAIVLLDIWMPDCDGITLLKEWSRSGLLDMPVIMMSGHASIDTAVEATKIGAFDFLEKPITLQKLLSAVQNALKYSEMQAKNSFVLGELGKSESIQNLKKEIERIKGLTGNIALLGEVGVPFDIVARQFKGNKKWLELEVDNRLNEISIEFLRGIQGGILYLGDFTRFDFKQQELLLNNVLTKHANFNVRIISAASKPLQDLFSSGQYLPEFLDKLVEIVVDVPPLREVKEDLPYLINRTLRNLIESKQIRDIRYTPQSINALTTYSWPGNMDQLKSVIKSLVIENQTNQVEEDEVLAYLSHFDKNEEALLGGVNFDMPLRELREEIEKRYFEYHIRQENHNMSRVAQKVGLERTHLYRKLKQLGVQFSKKHVE